MKYIRKEIEKAIESYQWDCGTAEEDVKIIAEELILKIRRYLGKELKTRGEDDHEVLVGKLDLFDLFEL